MEQFDWSVGGFFFCLHPRCSGHYQPRALRFINAIDPLVSVSNLYIYVSILQVS